MPARTTRRRTDDDGFLNEIASLSTLLPLPELRDVGHGAPGAVWGGGDGRAGQVLSIGAMWEELQGGERAGPHWGAEDAGTEGGTGAWKGGRGQGGAWARAFGLEGSAASPLLHPDSGKTESDATGDSPVFEEMGTPMHESRLVEGPGKRKWGGVEHAPAEAGTMQQRVAGGEAPESEPAVAEAPDEQVAVAEAQVACAEAAPPPASITVRFGDLQRTVALGDAFSTEELTRALLCAFELPPSSRLVLRCGAGRVVPLSARLCRGCTYTIDSSAGGSASAPRLTPAPSTRRSADATCRRDSPLRFVQEPPHGACQWLSVKMTQRTNEPRPAIHLVKPTMRVTVPIAALGTEGADDAQAVMARARVRLWTNGMAGEVSHFLHEGRVQVHIVDDHVEACWPELAFTAISAHARVHGVESTAISDDTGRAARGWFHLTVELPTRSDLPPLCLTSRGEPARIVVKHTRLAGRLTGRWAERRLGPYADHSRCTPAHIGPSGVRLCRCGGEQVSAPAS